MKTIAILCGRYLPGFKDGGPVRTLINICDGLGEEYRIKIITNDRDHGDINAYPNIVYDAPNKVGNAEAWYLKPKGFTFATIKKLTVDADLIYIFGPYDDYSYKTMWLKRFNKIKKPVVVASMGTFSEGAIGIKSGKKKLFLAVCKLFGLFKKIVWSVTSTREEEEVKKYIGKKAKCMIAEDLPRKVAPLIEKSQSEKLRVIFLSRICQKKNLAYAIEVISKIKSEIIFDVYGVIEDKEYFEKCQTLLEALPNNVKWAYKGEVATEKVVKVFSSYDAFLFPTLGENYGHVIFEALAGGCLPIISDTTPWGKLGAGVVKEYSLSDQDAFVGAIEGLADLDKESLLKAQKNANAFACKKYESSLRETGYRRVFDL